MNEVDPWLLLSLCVLYEMQNQIFQQVNGLGEEKLQITEELWRESREKLMRFCGKGMKRREVLHTGSLLSL